jgi:hypothetical protein
MEIKIVVPSHKRANKCLTKKVVEVIICVPESQKTDYEKHNPDCEIVTHPDSVIGLAAKRDWIYRYFGNVMMLDDDITHFRRVYIGPKENDKIGMELAKSIIEETAYCAKQAGAYLWGFSNVPNPTLYNVFEPIRLTGYITGCATGLLEGSRLKYNPQIKCNEDYWISCLNAYYHRIIWKDLRFCFVQKDTFTSAGGLAEFRSLGVEEDDFKLLKKYFGEAIQFKMDTKKAKRKHPYQKTMKLPF